MPAVHPTITGASIKRIRRLLAAIARNVPFTPEFAKMRRRLQIADDRTLKDDLAYLAIDDIEHGSSKRIPLWLFGLLR